MRYASQVLWLPFGFIPMITAIPESDGTSDTVDGGKKASAVVLPCYSTDGQLLENVIRREIASLIMMGIERNRDSKTWEGFDQALDVQVAVVQQ